MGSALHRSLKKLLWLFKAWVLLKGKVSNFSHHKSWWARLLSRIFFLWSSKAHIRDPNHDTNDIIMNPRAFQDKDPSLFRTCRQTSWILSSHTVVTTYLYHQGHLAKGVLMSVDTTTKTQLSHLTSNPCFRQLKISWLSLSVKTFFFNWSFIMKTVARVLLTFSATNRSSTSSALPSRPKIWTLISYLETRYFFNDNIWVSIM